LPFDAHCLPAIVVRLWLCGVWGDVVLRYIAIIACAFLLAACATITKGTTQIIAVDTPGVPGATCTITTQSGPQIVTTPGTITLSKSASALPIQCTRQCYLNGTSIIPSNAESMAAGNVIFGGIIGLGVDAASGALNKYPDMVTVAMTPDFASPDPACRALGRPPPYHPPPPPKHTSSAQ
jgi:hypothetical protein